MHKVSSDELGMRDSSTGEVNNPFLQTRNPTISLRAAIQSETNDPYCGNKFFKCGGRLAETDKWKRHTGFLASLCLPRNNSCNVLTVSTVLKKALFAKLRQVLGQEPRALWACVDTVEVKEIATEIASLVHGFCSCNSSKSTEKCAPRRFASWTVASCFQCRLSLGFELLPTQFYALCVHLWCPVI